MIKLVLFFRIIWAQSSVITQSATGCLKYSGTTCTELCMLGVRDCALATPQCEYGYFLFKSTCVQCPYQNIDDKLNLYCMDCVEDPDNWNSNRKCTFGYTVGNRNATYGAYIKNTYDYAELYYVGTSTTTYTWSGSITRSVSIPYQVYICSGCLDFCALTIGDSCNEISNDYQAVDTDKVGIVCLDGFYFVHGLCQTCTVLNCLTCDDNICSECNTGYYYQNNQCKSCPSNCLSCQLDETTVYCTNCDQSKTDSIYIPSLSATSCDQCGNQCLRCEYASYQSVDIVYPTRTGAAIETSSQSYYVKRCRQCISDSFTLSYDGINCDPCTIKYCSRCYYTSGTKSTMDLDFTPWSAVSTLLCYYCKSGYTLSADKQSCSVNTATITNCNYHYLDGTDLKCFQCQSGYFLYENSCQNTCSDQIQNCQYCFAFSDPDTDTIIVGGVKKTQNAQLIYQCMGCDSGYYPNFFTGLCTLCSDQCDNCWQYTLSYNLTDFLNTKPLMTESQKSAYANEAQQTPYCSTCATGFTQYGNTCKGCTKDCVVESPSGIGFSSTTSSCNFKAADAFCGMCYNYYRDRSLNTQQTECHECPKNCQACRERTTNELFKINPYFNPDSAELRKYGYLCYKYQTALDPSSNVGVDYDTLINMPVTCSSIGPQGQTGHCNYQQTITVQLFCDSTEYLDAYEDATPEQKMYMYKLTNYFQTTTEKVATIKFGEIDQYAMYSAMNEQVVKQVFFVVQIVKKPVDGVRSCQFDKSVKFVAGFQQNVFSLKSFIYILEGSQNNTLLELQIQGTLEFPSISEVRIKGINLNYYKDGAGFQKYFGFVLAPSIVGNLVLTNFQAGRNFEDETSHVPFYFNFSNSQDFEIGTVKFYNLSAETGDSINFLYTLTTITTQKFNIIDTQFINCSFSGQVLFQFNTIEVGSTTFSINGLKFYQSKFYSFTLFGEPNTNQKITATMQFQNIYFQYCEFVSSYFIRLKSLKYLQITNFDIIRSSFNSSTLIKSNHFDINNFYFDQNFLYSNSYFFVSATQVIKDTGIYESLSTYYFINATIQGTYCMSKNCIMNIKTPSNDDDVQASLQITNFSLLQTDSIDMITTTQEAVQLISIYNLQTAYINTFISDNNRGVRIVSIILVSFVSVKNSLYDWSENDMFTNGTFMSENKRIPVSQDCASLKTAGKYYSDIFLFITQYNDGVELDNIIVRSQLSIDTSFIVLISWDILQFNTTGDNGIFPKEVTEVIVLNNIQFITNSLVITSVFTQIASLYIVSEQDQVIYMNNCQFINNHLHKLNENSVRAYATTLYFNIPLTTITISDCLFSKNRATKSQYGIASILAQSTTIIRTIFQESNLLNMEWYTRLETPDFFTDDLDSEESNRQAMKKFFDIYSTFGNLQITSQNVNITQSQFLNGYSYSASGLYIIATEQAQINITNTIFQSQQTSLSSSSYSEGGCLYISALGAALEMTLNQVYMKDCIAYSTSGCIKLITSSSMRNIYIQQSNFENCQALDNQFMEIIFSNTQEVTSKVYISDSSFVNNSIYNYLMNLNQFNVIQLDDMFTSQFHYYKQEYGELVIKNSQFLYLQCVTILSLNFLQSLVLENVQISDNIIFIKPLVMFYFDNAKSVVVIKNTKLANNYNQSIYDPNTLDTLQYDSCNSYFKSSSSFDLDEQSCLIMIPIRLEFIKSRISKYTNIVLYNEKHLSDYSLLTSAQKYKTSQINKDIIILPYIQIKNPIQFQLYDTFDLDDQRQMQNCLYSLIYKRLGLQSTTALMYFSQFLTNSHLTVNSLLIEHNVCFLCQSGLFAVTQIQSTSQALGIIDTTCYNNTSGYYGCISLTQSSDIKKATTQFPITDLPVYNSSAEVVQKKRILETIGDSMLKNPNNVVYFLSSKFIQNRAKVGAGISIQGIAATVLNSQFSDNIASLMAGGIFFDSLSDAKQLQLYDVQFQGNTAQVGAGLFISASTFPSPNSDQNLLDISFSNNNGTVSANNLEEQPRRLTIQMKQGDILPTDVYLNNTGYSNSYGLIDSSTSPIRDIVGLQNYTIPNYGTTNYIILPSGQAINTYKFYYSYSNEQVSFNWQFRIINLDRFNQTMSNLQSTEYCAVSGRIMDSENYDDAKEFTSNFTDKTSYYFNTTIGAYDLDSMIITFDPYSESNLFLQLKFKCTTMKLPVFSITPPFSRTGQFNSDYALLANIRTFPCQLGEAYKLNQCQACSISEQTYAVKLKAESCSSINQNQMISVKPTAIQLKPGFYRPYFDSSVISYCNNLVANCNGGWDPGNPSCYTGHVGALCESCDIYNSRGGGAYSLSAAYTCGPCSGTTEVNSLIILGMSFFTLVSICLSVKGSYKMLEDFAHQKRLASIGVLISNESSNLSILIKLFTNYFQIISALNTFQLSFPSSLTQTVQVVGNPTKSMSYSLDCFLVDLSEIEILYFRMVWALLMPILYLAVFFFGYFIGVVTKYLPFKEGIIYTTFIYMFIYLQPTLVGGFISLASSRHISGYPWVQADVSYRSDSETHYIWLFTFILPLLFAWAIIFPSVFFVFVKRIKNNLDDLHNRMKLGYFYNEYNEEGYLWEFVKIFSKEMIIIFLTFYEDQVVIKGLVVFLIIFFYGGFTILFTPYTSKRLNFIDRLSTAICAGSICLGVLIYASTQEGLDYLVYIMFVIIAVLNSGFIFLMLFYLFQGYLQKFEDVLDKIRDHVRIYHPEISEKYPWMKKMLINKTKMKIRVKALWSKLREKVKQGIKRRRQDPNAPLFLNEIEFIPQLKPYDYQEGDAFLITVGNNSIARSAKVYPVNNDIQDSPLEL